MFVWQKVGWEKKENEREKEKEESECFLFLFCLPEKEKVPHQCAFVTVADVLPGVREVAREHGDLAGAQGARGIERFEPLILLVVVEVAKGADFLEGCPARGWIGALFFYLVLVSYGWCWWCS